MSEVSNKAAKEQLVRLAEQLFVNERKIYAAGTLQPRFEAVASRNRYDLTIQQVNQVITAMAKNSPAKEITASDLEALMNKFYTPGTNFRAEFGDLLDGTSQSVQKEAKRMEYFGDYRELDEVKGSVSEVDLSDEASSIESLIDPKLTYSNTDLPVIRYAAALVDEELKSTNRIQKSSIRLKYKTADLLVYEATFKTASGEANVFVPVELKDGNPLIPQVISTTEKVYTLDSSGVDHLAQDIAYANYVREAANAQKWRIDAGLADDIRNDTMGTVEVDEMEDLPQQEVHLGVDEIDSVLKDAVVRKESKFASSTIDYGRDLVAIELNDLGYRNPQVRFAGDTETGLTYSAVIDTEQGRFNLTVPVEASKGMLLNPSQFYSNDKAYELTQASLKQAVRDGNPKEAVHPFLYSMSYPELKKQLKVAAYEHKPKLAKAIISLIAEKFDSHYQNSAIDDYQVWLEEATSSYQTRCAGCNYYNGKTTKHADWCGLIKTETKNVQKDDESGICTRSIFAEIPEESDKIAFDNGSSIKL